MAPTTTPVRQRNAVSEGFAFGLLVCGHHTIPNNKIPVDLAFGHAWRKWDYQEHFLQVDTDLRRGSGMYIATHAGWRHHTAAFYWIREGADWVIQSRQEDWTPEDPEDLAFAVKVIHGDVPLEGWGDLARTFLDRLERRS